MFSEHSDLFTQERVSYNMVDGILAIDAKQYGIDVKIFKANRELYWVAINTYINLVNDLADEHAALLLAKIIRNQGLRATIQRLEGASKSFMRQSGAAETFMTVDFWEFYTRISKSEDVFLQCTRFLKRFCPLACSSVLAKEAEIKFLRINAGCRERHERDDEAIVMARFSMLDRGVVRPHDTVRKEVSRRVLEFLQLTPECLKTKPFSVDYTKDSKFSNGSTSDCGGVLSRKIRHLCLVDRLDGWLTPICWQKPFYVTPYTVKGKSVPKDWESNRFIAMEEAYPSYKMQAVLHALRTRFDETEHSLRFHYNDQSYQQEACEFALQRGLATVDYSSASDSISFWDAAPCLGPALDEVLKWRANTVSLQTLGREATLATFLTSGNPLTSFFEGDYFLAVADVATSYAQMAYDEPLQEPQVYNDDVIIDERALETLADVSEALGLKLNAKKTFGGDSLFRESCGVDYLAGRDVTSIYWPRRQLDLRGGRTSPRTLESIIQLQHKLYPLSWRASQFLSEYVRSCVPKMTCHLPGAECSDLWGELEVARDYNGPYIVGRVSDGDGKTRICWDISPSTEPEKRRKGHLVISDSHTPAVRNGYTEAFLYNEFLKHGPTYESELLRLLGVSSRRVVRDSEGDGAYVLVRE